MPVKTLLIFIFLLFPNIALANYLCTASSAQYPKMKNGLIFSKEVTSLGTQGTPSGHILLHKDEHFSYWLVAGTLLKTAEQPAKLIDYYVELHSAQAGSVIRAKSSLNDSPSNAQLELITYPKDSLFYQGVLLFSCKGYFG